MPCHAAPGVTVQRQVRAMMRAAAAVAPRLPVPIVGPLGYLDSHRVFSHPDTLAQFEADPVPWRSDPLWFFADMLDADTHDPEHARDGTDEQPTPGRGPAGL